MKFDFGATPHKIYAYRVINRDILAISLITILVQLFADLYVFVPRLKRDVVREEPELGVADGNYSGMLIGLSIVILCFLARQITAEIAEARRDVSSSASLRALRG